MKMASDTLRVRGSACIGAALALLLLPLNWIAATVLGAAVHEMGHLLAIELCGGQVCSCDLALGGARIEMAPLPPGKSVFCSLAGPLAGLVLLPLARCFPRLALCALLQSGFNLLPLQPLDGGQILQALTAPLGPTASAAICRRAHQLTLCALVLLCTWASLIARLGPLPLLAAGSILLSLREKPL